MCLHSQGEVRHLRNSLLVNLLQKKLSKSVNICRSYCKKFAGTFFMDYSVEYYYSSHPLSSNYTQVNQSTLQTSSDINSSDTIPDAALPFFIILKAFKISSLISSQGHSTFSKVVALSHVFSSFSSFSTYFIHTCFT